MEKTERIKENALRLFCNLIIIADTDSSWYARLDSYLKAVFFFAPIAFVANVLQAWFFDNKAFTTAVIAFVFLNMILGGWMHFRSGRFKWHVLILKTLLMLVVITITYFVLETIISFAGDNIIVGGFRAALQIATLLYPGGKMMKQIFILSDGQHPPKWVMEKIYNFQKNGDLKQFFTETKPK